MITGLSDKQREKRDKRFLERFMTSLSAEQNASDAREDEQEDLYNRRFNKIRVLANQVAFAKSNVVAVTYTAYHLTPNQLADYNQDLVARYLSQKFGINITVDFKFRDLSYREAKAKVVLNFSTKSDRDKFLKINSYSHYKEIETLNEIRK